MDHRKAEKGPVPLVTSLVNDIIMPLIGWIFGGIDFPDLKYVITPATEEAAEAAIRYGNFIQNIVNFLLVSLVIFTVIRAINRFHKKQEDTPAPPPAPAEDVVLLREIRDLIKKED